MTGDANVSGKISIRNVSKIFNENKDNEVVALKNVHLDIEPGELVSLVGPSGCGKSTLLRLVAGLETATDGELLLDETPIQGPHYDRGLVFQDPSLFPWLTVYGNVASGLKARKLYDKKSNTVEEYIKMIGLEGFEKSYPHQLSGGMAQRVSLARSFANQPKVLLLDEPFGALDAFTRMNMQDELLKIWTEREITALLVTHDIDEAIYLSDRIVIMTPRPGKIEEIIEVKTSRPRARNNEDFLHLRVRILETLNFAKRADDLSYYL
ncbi:MAG: ABC transporter ATP-binding protein [Clostridiales Family XIII bacterium]|jgi:ABC-type nitrate/sulfonate/bicarbonate transport system ATPase subunit|nr:ABC transporter ATP-binding protein [Clostridiales Family XIII bacterium]